MSSRARVALILPLAAAVLALASPALADTEPPAQTRATIRGNGKDVTIVYRAAPTGAPKAPSAMPRRAAIAPPAAAAAAPGPMNDAVRLAEKGADDQSLINFFRTHQNELPTVVDADDVRRLRRAGAGAAVISYLSRVTALDIGETAQGAPAQYAYANEPPPGYGDGYGVSADMGYPFYGSYGGYGSSGVALRHHHGRGFAPQARFGFSPRSSSPGRAPMHGPAPGRPTMRGPMPDRPMMRGPGPQSGMGRFRQP